MKKVVAAESQSLETLRDVKRSQQVVSMLEEQLEVANKERLQAELWQRKFERERQISHQLRDDLSTNEVCRQTNVNRYTL